jgi:hypothetical protein
VFPEVFDKDHIDGQIRKRAARPIISSRSHTAHEHAFTSADDMNDQIDEELERYLEQFDHEYVHEAYDPNQDLEEQLQPDSFLYTDEDQVYEDGWIASDHILNNLSKAPSLNREGMPVLPCDPSCQAPGQGNLSWHWCASCWFNANTALVNKKIQLCTLHTLNMKKR